MIFLECFFGKHKYSVNIQPLSTFHPIYRQHSNRSSFSLPFNTSKNSVGRKRLPVNYKHSMHVPLLNHQKTFSGLVFETMGKALTIPQAIGSKLTLLHKSLKESCMQLQRKKKKKKKLKKLTEMTTQGRLVTKFWGRHQGMKNIPSTQI